MLPLASFEKLMRREISLHGCWGYNLKGDEAFLTEALRRGSIPVGPMITREVDLADAPDAIAAMIEKRFYYCKVLVRM